MAKAAGREYIRVVEAAHIVCHDSQEGRVMMSGIPSTCTALSGAKPSRTSTSVPVAVSVGQTARPCDRSRTHLLAPSVGRVWSHYIGSTEGAPGTYHEVNVPRVLHPTMAIHPREYLCQPFRPRPRQGRTWCCCGEFAMGGEMLSIVAAIRPAARPRWRWRGRGDTTRRECCKCSASTEPS